MPWHVVERDGQFCVIVDADGSTVACHATRDMAERQVAALYANVAEAEALEYGQWWTLAAEATGLREAPASISADQREQWRKAGYTLPDGSWPIPNMEYLNRAISSWGRAVNAGNAAQVKRHMLKRARALGASQDKIDQINALGRSTEAEVDDDTGVFVEPMAEAGGDPNGSQWDVVIVRAGKSKNGRRYTEKVLQEAVPMFEGARVLARSDEEHIRGENTSVQAVVGWIESVHYERRALRGTLHLVDEGLRSKLLEAWNRGKRDLMGLSIVAEGMGRVVTEGGERVQQIEAITRVSSVDLVFEPAAGGELLRLVAAVGKEEPMLRKFIERLREAAEADIPGLLKGVAESMGYSVDELVKLIVAEEPTLTEALAKAQAAPDPAATGDPKPASDPEPVQAAEAGHGNGGDGGPADLVAAGVSAVVVRMELAETQLPEPTKKRITKRFAGQEFSYAQLTEAISDEVSTWAEIEKAGLASRGQSREVSVGREEKERAMAALTGFFAESAVEVDGEKVEPYRSIREAYIDLTGDTELSGRLPQSPSGKLGLSRRNAGIVELPVFEAADHDGRMAFRVAEALASTSWTEILGDSITRVMLREYAQTGLDDWRIVSDVVPVTDFRTQRRMRFGGYGDLPTVNQAAAYGALTSPGDEEATYAPTKRGGTETISLEAIANDDVGAIRRIPTRLARAAARTLYKFVFDFFRTNGNIYDGVAFFHATHANLLATTLSQASLTSARVLLFEQTDMSTNEQLGLDVAHLFVPIELEQLAYELTRSDLKPGTADNDANYTQSLGLTAHTVKYWTDSTDYVVTADKRDVPIIEVGFFGGEEPELFTQDMPNVGSMFDSDQLKYKIRHIYGGAVMDFRGAVKSVQ